MGMQCNDSLLQMYVDGAMGVGERLVVEAHLAQCAACRASLTAYKALLWDLAQPPAVEVPPELAALSDRLMEAWDSQQLETAAEKESALGSWTDTTFVWARTVPVVSTSVAAVGRMGRAAPRAAAGAVAGLVRRLWKGGGRR